MTLTANQAQDDLKSKSLDEREATIQAREKLLDSTDRLKQLELLDKQIAFKEQQLVDCETSKEQSLDELRSIQKQYRDFVVRIENANERDDKAKSKVLQELEQGNHQIEQAKKELAGIRAEITDRQKYLKEQEELVNTTIAEWNVRLGDFKQEGDLLQERILLLSKDIVRNEELHQELAQKNLVLTDKNDQLAEVYDRKLIEMKHELAEQQGLIQSAESALHDYDTSMEGKIQAIATKEQSLELREQALQTKEMDLKQREKRLNTRLEIVG